MSTWTQISGVIRVDGLFFNSNDIPDFDTLLGNTCSYNDNNDKWDKCNVPCGSEGSLSYKFISTEETNAMNIGTYVIWGSLRDYENEMEIYKWVEKITNNYFKGSKLMIRDLVFSIQINSRHYIIIYQDKEKDNRELIITKL